MKSIKIGMLGCGVVGGAVARELASSGTDLAARAGATLELTKVAVRTLGKRDGVADSILTTDADSVVSDPEISLVIEVMGGIEPARELILKAIANGKSVVTANKALLASHGADLYNAAEKAGVDLYYEAAVAGAIPIIRPLRESLIGDRINRVMGIVNGTTNFILTKMDEENLPFDVVLKEAQALGYAEADPTADVEGHDAAAKAAILAGLAFHTRVTSNDVACEGITKVSAQDVATAKSMNKVIKLIAEAASYLGKAIADAINLFNPRKIIIEGRIVESTDLYLSTLKEVIYKRAAALATKDLEIVQSKLGTDRALLGAAQLGIEQFFFKVN